MKIKKEFGKKGMVLLVGVLLVLIIGGLFMVQAEGGEGMGGNETAELDNLTSYLVTEGYEWLVNYSIEDIEIEIYTENESEIIVLMNDIIKYVIKKDNESYLNK